jgi:cell division protein FtsA
LNKSILAIDIGTTSVLSVVATNDFNNKINILGVGKSKCDGVSKGNIVDINLASSSIKESVQNAINSAGEIEPKVIVSVSSANAKTLRSNGSVNIPSGHITTNDIKQVLNMALYNAQVIHDYEVIHVLPIYFRVDEGSFISNPLNMNGSRLEVSVNVITIKKTALINIKNALKQIDLTVDKFVLSSYADAIATLENDQKKHGTAVINLGGTTSEVVIYKGSAIVYNDFLPIGSEHITDDISTIFHTPYSAANMIKKQYATLLPIEENSNEQNIRKVKLPIMGNETESKEISLDQIQPILHARIEEVLCLIRDRIANNSTVENIDGGIVITGGMTYIPGIKELAQEVFKDLPIKISNPINIQNGYIDFNNPTMSTIVGLLLYELGNMNNLELDSNNNIKQDNQNSKSDDEIKKDTKDIEKSVSTKETLNDIKKIHTTTEPTEEKQGFMGKMIKKITRWI